MRRLLTKRLTISRKDLESIKRGHFLIGVETGVRLAEKGMNLVSATIKAAQEYDGERDRISAVSYSANNEHPSAGEDKRKRK